MSKDMVGSDALLEVLASWLMLSAGKVVKSPREMSASSRRMAPSSVPLLASLRYSST